MPRFPDARLFAECFLIPAKLAHCLFPWRKDDQSKRGDVMERYPQHGGAHVVEGLRREQRRDDDAATYEADAGPARDCRPMDQRDAEAEGIHADPGATARLRRIKRRAPAAEE